MKQILVLGAFFWLTAGAPDEPPSDAEVFNYIRTIQMEYAELEKKDFTAAKRQLRAMIGRTVRGLDLAALTPYQSVLIGPLLVTGELDADQTRSLNEAFENAAADQEHGAAALLLLHRVNYWQDPERAYLSRFFEHPGMAATMNGWYGRRAINSFALEPEWMLELGDGIERAILSIHPDSFTEAPSRSSVARLLDALDHPEIAERTRDRRKRIHEHLLKVARSTLSKFAPTDATSISPEEYRMRQAIDLVDYLEGPAARSELIGHPAPDLEFSWVRGPDAPFSSLADLEGKVVVLDFWATWCGPCVATFPDIRKLQDHYADEEDVVIVGVTSLQGYHVRVGGGVQRLEGQPGREKALMAEYIDENDITWNIAFSTRDVIDPRFDVRGIPHLTLVDRQGHIRHNGLHPGDVSFEEKTKLIDDLLEASR